MRVLFLVLLAFTVICSCIQDEAKLGCTDPNAVNFDKKRRHDNGSCIYIPGTGCADPNFLNYRFEASAEGECMEVFLAGRIHSFTYPYFTMNTHNGVLVFVNYPEPYVFRVNPHSFEISEFKSELFNEYICQPTSSMPRLNQFSTSQVFDLLSNSKNEDRIDQLIRLDTTGVHIYRHGEEGEVGEKFEFDLKELIPSPQIGWTSDKMSIWDCFKANNYLYLWIEQWWSIDNSGKFRISFPMIRGSNGGKGSWEYVGTFEPSETYMDIAVMDDGRILNFGKKEIFEFNSEERTFTSQSIQIPDELRLSGIVDQFGVLTGEKWVNERKQIVHYIYLQHDEDQFLFWEFNAETDGFQRLDGTIQFGKNGGILRPTVIFDTEERANTFLNVNNDSEIFLFSPN